MLPNDHQQATLAPVNAPKDLLNNNNGPGTFNQVNGVQNIYHCSHFEDHPSTSNTELGVEGSNTGGDRNAVSVDRDPTHGRELEPYRTAIKFLGLIRQHLQSTVERFASEDTISDVCDKAEELVALLRCISRVIRQVRQAPTVLVSHSIFFFIEENAFKWTRLLKELENELFELNSCEDPSRTADITACRWTSLFRRLQASVRSCRHGTTQFLRIVVASRLLGNLDIEGLEELVARLVPKVDLHHPTVEAIWVREPTGRNWYSIPLGFCATWKDFSIVIHEYCRNGPEIEYIRRGKWAIVGESDNSVVDQGRFASILKPEMRFDIGVILELLSATLRTCPQCGYHNSGSTPVDGWITCSSLECGNLFRIVFHPSAKEANDQPHAAIASKSLHPVMRSLAKKLGISLRNAMSSLSRTRHPPSLSREETIHPNQASGGRKPELHHLVTRFHRVLANVPHSPQEQEVFNREEREAQGLPEGDGFKMYSWRRMEHPSVSLRPSRRPASRVYSDKILALSGMYVNWCQSPRIEPGDYGTLDSRTGRFLKEGSIFRLPSVQAYAAREFHIATGATARVHDYISSGAHPISPYPESNSPLDGDTTILERHFYFSGSQSAILIMHDAYQQKLKGNFDDLPKGDLLGKHLVTAAEHCTHFLMFLSDQGTYV
ncbi:hypothetical protein AB1N83_011185 [Pleurotus pulmonarius]